MTHYGLDYAVACLALTSLWLAGSGRWQGWLVGLLSEGVWVAYALVSGSYGLLLMVPAFTFVYARNLMRWRRGKEGAAP